MGSGLEPIPITSQKHDPAWKHCEMFKSGDKVQLKCSYCTKLFKGGGIHRIKEHLAGQKGNASTCPRAPSEVRSLMQQSLDGVVVKKRNRQKLDQELTIAANPPPEPNHREEDHPVVDLAEPDPGPSRKRERPRARDGCVGFASVENGSSVQLAVGRFLYDIGAPPDSVDSPYFEPMIAAIASGGGGGGAVSYRDLRGWVLKSLVEETTTHVDKHRAAWEKTGCSVLVDEQRCPESGRVFLNFSANSPEGTVFLRTAEVSSNSLYEALRSAVEEVGPANVVQVITARSGEPYAAAGRKLAEAYPSLYWAPCAVRSIDSILEDFASVDWISEVVEQARSATRFVYNSAEALNIVRRYTYGGDIVEPGPTGPATGFATLRRLLDLKHNLHAAVTSQEWLDCRISKRPGGLEFSDTVESQSFWSSCGAAVSLTGPILRALRVAGCEKRAAMGFVHAAMYRAKEAIKKELVKREDYLVYWDIIDQRWEFHRSFPLHAAGFYLNPKFFYGTAGGDLHGDFHSGLFDCIERLVPDTKVQDKIIKEITFYKNAAGDFGRKMAIRTRETLLPAEWWSTYGGGCPNLARLAIRILSQNCSVVRCKSRNQDNVRRVHETGNSLERQRLSDIVFVQNNLGLRNMNNGKTNGHDFMDPISSDRVCAVEEWIRRLEDDGDSDWSAIDPPSVNALLLGPASDDVEDLGTGFEDYEIFGRVKDGEDDNVVMR